MEKRLNLKKNKINLLEKLTDKEVIQLVGGICLLFENSDKKKFQEFIDEIYRAVHSHELTSCYDVHDDWRKEAVKNLKEYKKIGMC